jgi:hypothetical protein
MSCGVEVLAPYDASVEVLRGAGYLEIKLIYDVVGFRAQNRIYEL